MVNSGCGKMLKWVLGAIVVLLLSAGGWLHFRLAEFHDMTEELKDAGHPVSMAELRHKLDQDRSDALPLLVQAKPLLDQFSTDLSGIEMKYIESDGHCSRPNFMANSSEAKLVELKKLLDRNGELMRLVDRIFSCQDITAEITPVLNGSIKSNEDDLGILVLDFVALGSFSRVRSHVLNERGHHDLAIDNGLKSIEFGSLVMHRNTGWFSNQYSFHVAACGMQSVYEAISSSDPKDIDFGRINQVLEAFDWRNAEARAVAADRASAIEHIADQGIQHTAINGVAVLNYYAVKERELQLEVFEFDHSPVEYSPWQHGPWLMNLGASFDQAYLSDRIAAYSRVRGLRIITALMQNEVTPEEYESFEDKRAALVRIGVPEKMTIDTCTSEVMRVKFEDGIWKSWSVGINKLDDSGFVGLDAGLATVAWKTYTAIDAIETPAKTLK